MSDRDPAKEEKKRRDKKELPQEGRKGVSEEEIEGSVANKSKLNQFISKRPDREDLVTKNILKHSSLDVSLAPSLVALQEKLQWERRQDTLNSWLDHRPSLNQLVEANIWKDAEEFEEHKENLKLKLEEWIRSDRPDLKDLPSSIIPPDDKEQLKQFVENFLKQRPSPQDLQALKVFKPPLSPTPSSEQSS